MYTQIYTNAREKTKRPFFRCLKVKICFFHLTIPFLPFFGIMARLSNIFVRPTSIYMKGLQEKKLLYLITAQKDSDAFSALYDFYLEKVYRFVFFKLSHKEEAEDVTSEVFLKAWNYLTSENQEREPIRSFAALIYRIARNAVVDAYRRRPKSDLFLKEDQEISDLNFGQKKMEDSGEREMILLKIKKLKQEYQDLILLRFVEDLSIGEIAKIIGKNEISTRVAIHRALTVFKKIYQ